MHAPVVLAGTANGVCRGVPYSKVLSTASILHELKVTVAGPLKHSLSLYHRGWQMFITGGQDGSVRLWQAHLPDLNSNPVEVSNTQAPTLVVQLLAVWELGSAITILTGYRSSGIVMVGDVSGGVHLLSADRALAARSSGVDVDLKLLMGSMWAQRPFDDPVSAVAFSADGDYASACSASANKVVFFKIAGTPGGGNTEITFHVLGFYEMASPQTLAWAPHDSAPGAGGLACMHSLPCACICPHPQTPVLS